MRYQRIWKHFRQVCAEGYKERKTTRELIRLSTQVPDLTAIELVEGWHVNKQTVDEVKGWVDEAGLQVSIIHYELLYWLEATGYDGWYSLDIFPYREDGVKAADESIKWLKSLRKLIEKIGMDNIKKVIEKEDPVATLAMIREAHVFGMFLIKAFWLHQVQGCVLG